MLRCRLALVVATTAAALAPAASAPAAARCTGIRAADYRVTSLRASGTSCTTARRVARTFFRRVERRRIVVEGFRFSKRVPEAQVVVATGRRGRARISFRMLLYSG